jgi:hypothetical protein
MASSTDAVRVARTLGGSAKPGQAGGRLAGADAAVAVLMSRFSGNSGARGHPNGLERQDAIRPIRLIRRP